MTLQGACFWTGAGWLGYVYPGYRLLLGLIACLRRVHPEAREDYWRRVSVLIRARTGVHDIGWKVSETLGSDCSGEIEVPVAAVNDSRLRRMRPRSITDVHRILQEAM